MKTTNYYKIYERYITNNEPIPYKGLLIYPVLWKDIYMFVNSVDILDIKKDDIPDAKIISMSYLEFILTLIEEELMNKKSEWVNKFMDIFSICLHINDFNELKIVIDDRTKQYSLEYKDNIINSSDFDAIRKIILYQNIKGYDDSYIDPEVRASIEKYYAIKNKDIEVPSLEKTKIILMSNGFSLKDIQDMTYREVELLKDMMHDKIEYITDKILAPHMDSKKFKLEDWMYKKEKNKYEEAFVDADSFKNKLSQHGSVK